MKNKSFKKSLNKNSIWNKKGFELLGNHTVNIIIAVLAISVLVYLGFRVYGMFSGESEIEQSQNALNAISEKLNVIADEGTAKILIFPPENWWLVSGDKFPINDRECLKKSCICFCEEGGCDFNRKVCQGYDMNVVVEQMMFGKGAQEIRMVLAEFDKVIIRMVR
jgi:hypothetical protein